MTEADRGIRSFPLYRSTHLLRMTNKSLLIRVLLCLLIVHGLDRVLRVAAGDNVTILAEDLRLQRSGRWDYETDHCDRTAWKTLEIGASMWLTFNGRCRRNQP